MQEVEKLKTGAAIELVKTLSDAFGPSGLEDEVRQILKTSLEAGDPKEETFEFKEDSIGNLYVKPVRADPASCRIVLDAHIDEVGFMVQNILANGTLSFLPLGGWDPANAAGLAVEIRKPDGSRKRGIVASIPPHFQNIDQRAKPDFATLHIDVGAVDRQSALEIGMEPGLFILPQTACTYDEELRVFCGKAFDDRIGCAAQVLTLQNLAAADLKHVEAVFTAQEEVGERGMMAAVDHLKARLAICFEGCPADDTFGESYPTSAMKAGPMIRAFDKSMITHPKWLDFARKTARKYDLPLQIAVRKGGGTNGGILHTRNIPTIVIGIPTRYAHSQCCFCSLDDLNHAVKLAVKIIEEVNRVLDKDNPDPADCWMKDLFAK